MKEEKRIIMVDDFQHGLLINGINEFRNVLLEQDKPTEDVDELLLKIIDAPTKRELRRASREAR